MVILKTHPLPESNGGVPHPVRNDRIKGVFEHPDRLCAVPASFKLRENIYRMDRQALSVNETSDLAHTNRLALDIHPIEVRALVAGNQVEG